MQGHSKSSRDISVWDVCRAPHSATKKDREQRRGQPGMAMSLKVPGDVEAHAHPAPIESPTSAGRGPPWVRRVVSNRDRPHIPNRAPPLMVCGLSYAGHWLGTGHIRRVLSTSRRWLSSGDGYPGCFLVLRLLLSTVPIHLLTRDWGVSGGILSAVLEQIRLRTEQIPGPLDPSSPYVADAMWVVETLASARLWLHHSPGASVHAVVSDNSTVH